MAIGAFVENKVFIFHGQKYIPDEPLKPVQILIAEDEVQYFGYSITAADMDLNGYSDIAVGSLYGGVTLFRSRPIIDLHADLSYSLGSGKKQIKLEKGENDQVSINFCFGFQERSGTRKEGIKVRLVIIIIQFPARKVNTRMVNSVGLAPKNKAANIIIKNP